MTKKFLSKVALDSKVVPIAGYMDEGTIQSLNVVFTVFLFGVV